MAKQPPLPKGQFQIILADPPWFYTTTTNPSGNTTGAANHYRLVPDAKMLRFPMRKKLTDPGILFLWTTGPRMDFAFKCIEEWGLAYRGVAFVWVKCSANGVPWGAKGIRPSIVKPLTEFVLAASTKALGRPLPLSDESVTQTVFAPVGRHSEKPTEVAERIERMYPNATKLELFARRHRAGWESWGNEV